MMKSFKLIVIGLMAMFLFGGCGDSVPTESEGEEVLKAHLNKSAKILYFKKTNGKKNGDGSYTMYYEAKYSFPDGLNLNCKKFRGKDGFIVAMSYPQESGKCMLATIREKGEEVTKSGKIYFEKTENGWIGEWSDF